VISDRQWKFVEVGAFAVAFGLPLLLLVVVRLPRRWRWRAPLVIFLSWIALSAYMTEAYCRIGIARAEQRGEDPNKEFDNNNVGPVLLTGWIFPSISVGVAALVRRLRTRVQGSWRG
jgi:hypothetical protein